MFLFLDTETTGLNPNEDHLLEVGFILTDNDLRQLDTFDIVICPSHWMDGYPNEIEMPEIVFEMHQKSGLLHDIATFGIHLEEAERLVLEWLNELELKGMPVTGSSVRFDRTFLEFNMPAVNEFLHYRIIDISTLKELARVWDPEVMLESPKDKAHRVLADCRASIMELKIYRKAMLNHRFQ